MARPRKWIDRRSLKMLCEAQCSNDEIANALRVSWSTIERRYAEAVKVWRSEGPMSARRRLYELGMREDPIFGKDGDVVAHKPTSVPALIFYLKNYGGMSDQLGVKHSGGVEFIDLTNLTDEQLAIAKQLVDSVSQTTQGVGLGRDLPA